MLSGSGAAATLAPWRVHAATPGACAFVARGAAVRVVHAGRERVVLADGDGEVLVVGVAEAGRVPCGVEVNRLPHDLEIAVGSSEIAEAAGPRPGRRTSGVREPLLPALARAIASAPTWNPCPRWDALHDPAVAPTLADFAARHAADLGARPDADLADLLPAAGALAHSLAHDDAVAALTAVRALAGRGPGLTPAGDDLLVGAFLALHATRPTAAAGAVAAPLAAAAAGRTTTLSAAWIRAAARGDAAVAWHMLVEALVRAARSTAGTGPGRFSDRAWANGTRATGDRAAPSDCVGGSDAAARAPMPSATPTAGTGPCRFSDRACAAEDRELAAAVAAAVERIAATGASSGRATLAGFAITASASLAAPLATATLDVQRDRADSPLPSSSTTRVRALPHASPLAMESRP